MNLWTPHLLKSFNLFKLQAALKIDSQKYTYILKSEKQYSPCAVGLKDG